MAERGRGLRSALGRLLKGRELGTLPAWSPAWNYTGFTALALVAGMGGVGAEYKLDPYGLRRPEGPFVLKEADPKRVQEVLAPTTRVRQ